MKKNISQNRAFTLIEMLVVIAIIGILSGIIVTNLASSRARARDAKRISDIAQIQLALEQYFDRCGRYPSILSVSNPGSDCTNDSSINLGNFISVIPTDTGGVSYGYAISSNFFDYALHATLENSSESIKDSLSSAPSGYTMTPSSFTCGNAVGSLNYCVGPK